MKEYKYKDDLGGQDHQQITQKNTRKMNLTQIQIQIDKNTNTKMTLGARTTNRSHRIPLENVMKTNTTEN